MKNLKRLASTLALLILGGYLLGHFKMNVTQPDYMDSYFEQIEAQISNRDVRNTEVSQSDVAWHLDHMLKAINNISKELSESDPAQFTSEFNPIRTVVLTSNIIPRGAAQAPASVKPPDDISTQAIYDQLAQAKKNAKMVFEQVDENGHFNHNEFGVLNKSQAMRLMQVHTHHHLKIINDILNQ